MESDGEVMRTNTHQSGSRVCFRGDMYTCEEGTWRNYGSCTGYKDWQKRTVERLEGEPGRLGAARPSSRGGGSEGGASGGGGNALENLLDQNENAQDRATQAEQQALMGSARQAAQANNAAQAEFDAGGSRGGATSGSSSWNDFNRQFNQQAQGLYARKAQEAQGSALGQNNVGGDRCSLTLAQIAANKRSYDVNARSSSSAVAEINQLIKENTADNQRWYDQNCR